MKKTFYGIFPGILMILITVTSAHAQKNSYNYDQSRFNPYLNRMSYSIGIGLSAYNGELSGFFDPSLQNYYLNPGGSVGFSYRFFDHLSARGEINVFRLYSESVVYQERNRYFSGFNFDYYINAVVDLFPKSKIDARFYKWDGHIFGGIGQAVFFPLNNDTGDRKTGIILSSDTATTNNEYDYARLSAIFPVGAGVKYYFDKNHFISLEGIYRFTRTDFLDALKDLSHPAFDKYFSLMIKYTVIIDTTPLKTFRYDQYINGRKKRSKE